VKFRVEIDVEIRRSAEDIFDFLANFENAVTWASEFERIERQTDGPVGQGTAYQLWLKPPSSLIGLLLGREEMTSKKPASEVKMWWGTFERPRKLVSESLPFMRGRAEVFTKQTFEHEPVGEDTTRARVAWDRDVHRVPLDKLVAPLVKWLITREIRRTQTKSLERLKNVLERGGSDAAERPEATAEPR